MTEVRAWVRWVATVPAFLSVLLDFIVMKAMMPAFFALSTCKVCGRKHFEIEPCNIPEADR